MTRVFPSLVLAAMCAFAQIRTGRVAKPAATAPTIDKWLIASLAVEGNQLFPAGAILTVTGLTAGQVAGTADFDAARDRLTESGAFASVGYRVAPAARGKGFTATFEVVEDPSLFPAQFEDLGAADSEIVKALLAHDPLFSMSHLPSNQATLDRDSRWIEEYLATKGLHDKVAASVTSIGADRLAVVFRPAKQPPAVSEVSFEGNKIVPGIDLRSAVTAAAIGSPYTESNFRRLLEASVRPVYETRGRLHVTFPKIRIESDPEIQGVHVFVTVDEGEIYKLGKVTVAPPAPLPSDQLLAIGDFKTGDIDNSDLVAAGVERIRKAIQKAGYLDGKATSERSIDEAKKTAEVVVHIDAGSRYQMGKLTLTGLDLEGEAEIKRMWTLKEGRPFNPDYPDLFLERVRTGGVFDHLGKTKAETKIDDKTHTVDVTLTFSPEEKDPSKPVRRKIG